VNANPNPSPKPNPNLVKVGAERRERERLVQVRDSGAVRALAVERRGAVEEHDGLGGKPPLRRLLLLLVPAEQLGRTRGRLQL